MQVVPFFARLKTRLTLLVVAGITVPASAIALLCIDWTEAAVVAAGRDRNRVVVDEIERHVIKELEDLERGVTDMTKRPGVIAALRERAARGHDANTRPIYVLEKKAGVLSGKNADTTLRALIAKPWEQSERMRYATLRGDDGIRRLTVATRVHAGPANALLGYAAIQSAGREMFAMIRTIAHALGKGTFAFVLDDQGRVLMHSGDSDSPPDLAAAVGTSSKKEAQAWTEAAIGGQPHFYTARNAPRSGWRFGLATMSSELLTTVESGKQTVLLTTLIALVVAVIAGLLFSARVTRPITMLHKSVDSFTRGESKFVEVASVDEVGLLCQAYNQLLEDLVASQDSLELALAKTCDMHAEPSAQLAATNAKLRTAIARIVGLTELVGEEDEGVQARVIEALKTTVSGLVSVLDDTSRLPSAQFGDVSPTWVEFSLVKLMEDLSASLNGRHSSDNACCTLEFATQVPATIVGDPGAIQRSLLNVASYVRDHSTDGTVTLKVTYDVEATAQLRIDVSDSCANVGDEDLETLFRGFSDLEEGDGDDRRAGLTGLSISQRLARLQGGDLVFARPEQSEAPHFFASFAVVAGAGADWVDPGDLIHGTAPSAGTAGSSDLAGLHVVCAEDGPGDIRLLSYSIEQAGATVIPASDASEVIETAATQQSDVVVLDLDAPGLDGPDTAARLRAAGYTNPIVAVSTQTDIAERCQLTACDRYLVKPVPRRLLVASIHELATRIPTAPNKCL